MEQQNNEALIRLLDDPDELVFEAVSKKIQEMGPGLLPDLENAARGAMAPLLHERLERIIRLLQFKQLKDELHDWIRLPFPRLLDGAWLMTRYQFPDISIEQFSVLIRPVRDEIWLEISDTLTAIEKIRIMNALLFGKPLFRQNESHPDSPGNNFLNRMLETGKANEHSILLLYAILAQELEMPVFIVEMPEYPILAYVDMPKIDSDSIGPELFGVLFYINPTDKGTLHSHSDITGFLTRHSLPTDQKFYEPKGNAQFIRICLERLAHDYQAAGSEFRTLQVQELLTLWK